MLPVLAVPSDAILSELAVPAAQNPDQLEVQGVFTASNAEILSSASTLAF